MKVVYYMNASDGEDMGYLCACSLYGNPTKYDLYDMDDVDIGTVLSTLSESSYSYSTALIITAKTVQEGLRAFRKKYASIFNAKPVEAFLNNRAVWVHLADSVDLDIVRCGTADICDVEKLYVVETQCSKNNVESVTAILDTVSATLKERESSYGSDHTTNLTNIATIASIMCNKDLTASDIAKILIALKLVRESASHKEDNLVDLISYTCFLNDLEGR